MLASVKFYIMQNSNGLSFSRQWMAEL